MERLLISGGNGFVGRKIINHLIRHRKKTQIRIIGRNVDPSRPLPLCQSPGISCQFVTGDIRDEAFVKECMEDVDTVIHLAALKDITQCEQNPVDAVRINIEGSIHLLDHFKGDIFLAISSNKAICPESCYGATKLLMERIILDRAGKNPTKKFIVVRPGNILDSDGGVVSLWKNQIQQRNEIGLTNPAMTRFFITSNELSACILDLLDHGKTGRVYVPEHTLVRMGDLADAVVERFGNAGTRKRIIGSRSGESVHDLLFLPQENIARCGCTGNDPDRHQEVSDPWKVKELLSHLE